MHNFNKNNKILLNDIKENLKNWKKYIMFIDWAT